MILNGGDSVKVGEELRPALQELLNVSQLEFNSVDGELKIAVEKADGEKCERCWHWELDVGKNTEHPTLCGRCVGAVKQ